jgi:precorrin-2/cobalt-factor-2 C20-methyltransferase
MAEKLIGKLYGIGVGPGDPQLLTLKAHRILSEVPFVAYPKSRMGRESYALSIALPHINQEKQELLGLFFPMTRDQEKLEREWNEVVSQLWQRLSQGHDVAFVTEGDPLMYSTFAYMMTLMGQLHPEVEMEVVPGVSSVNGAAARLALPLADKDDRLGIIPAIDDREAMKAAIASHETVVFIKVAKVLDMMINILEEMGLADKAAVVTKVSSGQERIERDVVKLKGETLEYLTLMVVKNK